jgi:hypothetical protein
MRCGGRTMATWKLKLGCDWRRSTFDGANRYDVIVGARLAAAATATAGARAAAATATAAATGHAAAAAAATARHAAAATGASAARARAVRTRTAAPHAALGPAATSDRRPTPLSALDARPAALRSIPAAIAAVPGSTMMVPAMPAGSAAPAVAATPRISAVIPARSIPGVPIEAIPPAAPDEDLRLLDNGLRIDQLLRVSSTTNRRRLCAGAEQ